MRVLARLVGLAVVLAVAGIGIGLAYAPARPPLRQALDRVGLGGVAQRLFGPTDTAGASPAASPASAGTVQPLPPAITVVRATTREFRDQVFVSGTLVARDEALVGPGIDGLRITEVAAEDGDTVHRGDVLARLDRTQLDALLAENDAVLARADASIAQAQSQIAQFEAASTQADADLGRARKMESGTLSQATVDQRVAASRSAAAQFAAARSALDVARADKASQQAQRRELEVRIARTEVRAPVDGVISRRTARLGALAMNGGDPLFRLVANGAIDLDAEATDDTLARVRLGLPAKIQLQGAEEKVVGTVRLISAEVDRATRLGHVRLALPGDVAARIGSFATAAVEISRRRGIGIPASAVTSRDGVRGVEVVVDGRIALRPVELGIVDHATVEVTRGLADGDSVVARAAAFLRDGDAVRPMPATQEAQR